MLKIGNQAQFVKYLVLSMSMILWLVACAPTNESGDGQTSQDFTGMIIADVIDGDTFRLNDGEKVRLIGVDTPEISSDNETERQLGLKAKQMAEKLLKGKKVRLDYDVQKRDRYGRLLAYVYLDDGVFFNELLLREGYAQVMTVPPNVKFADHFIKVQREARDNNRGLWGEMDLDTRYVDNEGRPLIKGNINSRGEKIYHMPGGKYYERVDPEEWFYTEREALDAGFRRSRE